MTGQRGADAVAKVLAHQHPHIHLTQGQRAHILTMVHRRRDRRLYREGLPEGDDHADIVRDDSSPGGSTSA